MLNYSVAELRLYIKRKSKSKGSFSRKEKRSATIFPLSLCHQQNLTGKLPFLSFIGKNTDWQSINYCPIRQR